jgi:xanthine/CO dehydrogenase XdhC/CoxF family maturation factor
MKELQEILKKISNFTPDEKAILATVVDVQGSAYRLPGAKMLITETGETFGTVSGGCLEADVLERAKNVLKTGEPQVFVYDTSKNEESVFSLNMGCRGVIRILFEPVSLEDKFVESLQLIWFENHTNILVATVISSSSNEIQYKIGSKIICIPPVILKSDFDKVLQERILKIAEIAFSDEKSRIEEIDNIEIFFEFISAPIHLFIFGAGTDAIPLSVFAKNLGWRVYISDHRPAYANKTRFPNADSVTVMRYEDFGGFTPSRGNYVAVVMSHNYSQDKEIISKLFKTNAKYIGALGPKKRTEKLLEEIGERWRENLYAPVGLDIGAETPEEIALAIIAEIQSVLKNRNGGFLRDRQGGIH